MKKIIEKHLKIADKLAEKEVERLARLVLLNNPKLREFIMGMGSFFFTDSKDEIIHTSMGNNDSRLNRLKGYKRLVKFVEQFDSQLKITGTPMRFTAKGKKITDW